MLHTRCYTEQIHLHPSSSGVRYREAEKSGVPAKRRRGGRHIAPSGGKTMYQQHQESPSDARCTTKANGRGQRAMGEYPIERSSSKWRLWNGNKENVPKRVPPTGECRCVCVCVVQAEQRGKVFQFSAFPCFPTDIGQGQQSRKGLQDGDLVHKNAQK